MSVKKELVVTFEESNDFGFIELVYHIVDATFALICNRRNTTCTYMDLVGEIPLKLDTDGEKRFHHVSQMFFYDQYREQSESKKKIAKTTFLSAFHTHLDQLFQLVADDFSGCGEESATISIASIPPSIKRRKLIDLQQSLHITSAFEFYVRKYLPPMREEKGYHTVIKMMMDEFAEKCRGKEKKARKLALNLKGHVVQDAALADKIIKAYEGYENWESLKSCLDNQWLMNETDIH